MAFSNRYKKFAVGGFVQYSYSPKWLSLLSYFDRRPLIIFLGWDSKKGLIHGLQMHWLTKTQRKKVIDIIRRAVNMPEEGWDFGKPFPVNIYKLLKSKYPIATIAYRTYFPGRMRNISYPAFQWEPEKVEDKIINTDTAKIIGTSPEAIQKLAIKALRSRGQTQKRKAKRRSERYRSKKR